MLIRPALPVYVRDEALVENAAAHVLHGFGRSDQSPDVGAEVLGVNRVSCRPGRCL
jgi:hypothetical protein